jgi:hypothetical protein
VRGPVRYSATGLSSPGTSPTNGSGSFWSLVAACRNAYGDYRELQRSVFRRRVWCSFDMGRDLPVGMSSNSPSFASRLTGSDSVLHAPRIGPS